MFSIVSIAAITGWACNCGSGSDHPSGSEVRNYRTGEGLLTRYHDFEVNNVSLSNKDVAYLRNWLETGDISIGLLVPQAPGAIQPGSITTGTQNVWLYYIPNGGAMTQVLVPLVSDPATAQKLETLFPSSAEQQWQALKPENYDWLANVPTQMVTIDELFGSLMYEIDFHGSDFCNHCQIQLTGCTNRQFSFGEEVLLATFGLDEYTANDELTCANPVPTTVLATEPGGNPLPGPVVLSFGFWGGPVYEPTVAGNVAIPYKLRHTASITLTIDLQPIQSEQGWNYHWENMTGNTVTQVDIPPLRYPLWQYPDDPTVQLVGSSLPTCVRDLDTVHLSASIEVTPTITAHASTPIQILPDVAICDVADVGIAQTASAASIDAGETVTLTWTLTNFESVPIDMVVTATLSSSAAVSGVVLPGGCARNGTVITCTVANVPAGGTHTLQVELQTSAAFDGVLSSLVGVEPVGATDGSFYDNTAGPLSITITGGTGLSHLYLPVVER